MKKRAFFLYVLVLYMLGSWLQLHHVQAAGDILYWSEEKTGTYQPLHPYTLEWSGDVLKDGGFDIVSMTITKDKTKADFVMNQSDIGAAKIVELPKQDLKQQVDLRQITFPENLFGPQKVCDLKAGGIYLFPMSDGKFAKLRIDQISTNSVKFTFVTETAQPSDGNNPEKDPSIARVFTSQPNVTIYAGESKSVPLTAEYKNNTKKSVAGDAFWYSKHLSTAVVSKGKITGIAPGNTTITAEYKGFKVNIQVKVLVKKVTPIKGIPNTAVAGGGNHTLVLKKNGTVWSFGRNESGQLGTGDNKVRFKPVQVKGLNNVKEIAAGYSISFALKKDGTVWIWGDPMAIVNGPRTYPQQIPYLNNVVAIAAGDEHLMALKKDGTVWVWGNNAFGQGGIGTTSPAELETPAKVKNLTKVVSIGAGRFHSLAVKSDGTVWAWGYNNWGQIGNGRNGFGNILLPTKVLLTTKAKKVSGGTYHSLAVAADDSAYSWGYNDKGQLGIPKNNLLQNKPEQIRGINGDGFLWQIRQLDGGDGFTVAVANGGAVYSWGENDYGKLGNNSSTDSLFPVKVPITNVVQAEAGEDHTVVLKSDGTVWAWGSNIDGQLGVGSIYYKKSLPVKVMNANTPPLPPKVNTVTNLSKVVKGTAEAGAKITVKAGKKTFTSTTKSNGGFEVKISTQKADTVLYVTAGNSLGSSAAVKVKVKDVIPPAPPKVKTVTSRDSNVKGTSEPGATIKVKAGSKTFKGTVNKNKTFTVKISKQKAGTILAITATDKAGNVSKARKIVVKK
ncbi:Ig-like domain-containing protein [Lederbergia citrea]|uniref:RCC1 domain-containing protein n=1 Tax=Lederbergia citrea TaxID=2833581 RepID=UPI001BC9512F|nr:Ig-like domain-containing protein [Lederbergia citrea]MBS4177648.1 hypothetical protein [Lederbergia citrea]MBS4204325.1 hypothetical protein [Lederbergia citrea]